MTKQLRLFINPRWTISKFEEFVDLPEGWGDWTEQARDEYVEEMLAEEVADRGYTIVDDEDDGETDGGINALNREHERPLTPGGTVDVSGGAPNPQEMPGMWDNSDVMGGETDNER